MSDRTIDFHDEELPGLPALRCMYRSFLVFVLVPACLILITSGQAQAQARLPSEGLRIIDACSFITKWRPARLRCYDMWLRWCPLIAEADARTSCIASLQAAKAGKRIPPPVRKEARAPAEKGKSENVRQDSAKSRNDATGETTSSVRNPDGSRTVTRTDANGNLLERYTVPKSRPTMAAATDPKTGITTKSVRNNDGSRTVTRTDAAGNVVSTVVMPKKSAAEISSEDSAGNTTHSVRNPDGSRTVTVTDASGNVISKETRPPSKKGKARVADNAAPKPAKAVRNPAPKGARMLNDFCSQIGNPVARTNCYGFGKMVKQLCNLMPASRERSECKSITAPIPERLGPFDG